MRDAPPSLHPVYRIGAFDVHPSRNLIARDECRLTLEPRHMDVLCALAECAGEVIARTDLIDRVWGMRFGGDQSLSRAISRLRKTLAEGGADGAYIETIPKRGYRLVQPVSGLTRDAAEGPRAEKNTAPVHPHTSAADPGPGPTVRIPASYSVAVAPLETPEGGGDAMLADNVGRDLVAMLARAPHLHVAAYDTGCPRRGAGSGPAELAARWRVRYVVSGSLARHDARLTLRLDLIDAVDNLHVFSWREERPSAQRDDDANDELREIVLDLSTAILSEIQIAEGSAAHLRGETASDGYGLIQSAEMLRGLYSEERAAQIVAHLRELVEREPDNGVAHASLAVQLAQSAVSFSPNRAQLRKEAHRHLAAALRRAPNDADVLAAAGVVATMEGDMDAAIRHLTRSLRRNPANPHALAVLGWQICARDGDPAGIEMIRTAERRAPHHPRRANWIHYRATSEVRLGRWREALASYRLSVECNPNYIFPQLLLGTVLAGRGRDDEARAAFARALEDRPNFELETYLGFLDNWSHCWPDREEFAAAREATRRTWPA